MDAGAVAMLIPIFGMATGALFMVGVYKLVVRWLDRGRGADAGGLADEVAQLRDEVERLREGQERLMELEERMDFAERLLAQRREAGRIVER